MRTTHCLIYGSPDERQVVQIAYEFIRYGSFFGPTNFEINSVVILTPLTITPSDLVQDITTGIAEDFWVCEDRIRIECEIVEAVEEDMIFIGGGEPLPVFAI